MSSSASPIIPNLVADWAGCWADTWASTVLRAVQTQYPWSSHHVSVDATSCDVTPHVLHPSFYGSFDWHSSAHMQWSGLTLLETTPSQVSAEHRAQLIALFDERWSDGKPAQEADYLRADRIYERPYGWGWAALLAARAATSEMAQSRAWDKALQPLADAIADNFLAWLPQLALPVRHGNHPNTAFALGLARDAYALLNRPDVVSAIDSAALSWFADDKDYPSAWEPSGNDFLSPALTEADLMRRIMSATDFSTWLAAFLPDLGSDGDALLTVPEVRDTTDGHLVHQFGLALSRAAMLRQLVPYMPQDRHQHIVDAAKAQFESCTDHIAHGDFMSTHWLVSFALLGV